MILPSPSRLIALCFLVFSSSATALQWEENFDTAVAKAKADGKDLFVEFTGSDWCPSCIRLEKEIFGAKAFTESIPKNFILVKLDFPQKKKLPDALAEQNDSLLNRFQIEAFPTVLLLDQKGRPYGATGYAPEGPTIFLENVAALRSARDTRDAKFSAAEKAEGQAKAKALAEGLAGLDTDLVSRFYDSELEELRGLDPEDKLGALKKYTFKSDFAKLQKELQEIAATGEDASYLAVVDAFVKERKLKGENKQLVLMEKMLIYRTPNTFDQTEKVLKEVVAVDSKTPTATRAEEILARLKDIRAKLEEDQGEN